jgi:hypothetical protein
MVYVVLKIGIKTRVTRLGEVSPVGRLLTLGRFLKRRNELDYIFSAIFDKLIFGRFLK